MVGHRPGAFDDSQLRLTAELPFTSSQRHLAGGDPEKSALLRFCWLSLGLLSSMAGPKGEARLPKRDGFPSARFWTEHST